MTAPAAPLHDARPRRFNPWQVAWLVAAVIYAIPIGIVAYQRVTEVTWQARARLIVEYRLWELHPEYHGTPAAWTRFAARLLTDRQLLRRVRRLHRALADEIELDYRRDLTIAQGEVILGATLLWALPLAGVYGLGWALARRRRPRPAVEQPLPRATYSIDKYRP